MTKAELISRWGNLETINLPDSPFGATEEGHSDFRGFAFLRKSEIKAFKLENCDFSYANFTKRWIQGTTFNHCVFDNAVLSEISDHTNRFTHCTFRKTNFKKAALGFKASRFTNCLFEGCDFTGSIFSNAIFKNCTFIENKLKSVDFQVSGFWDCSFTGVLSDLTFRGQYQYKDQKERDPFPQEVGLHRVDFTEAVMSHIALRNNCPIDNLKLPNDGSAFMCKASVVLERLEAIVETSLSKNEHERVDAYLKALSFFARDRDYLILTLAEMIDSCEDELLGNKLFFSLKEEFEKPKIAAANPSA
jgi:uncharacterized protein YjbI with pentapeptide repeats